MSEGIQGFSKPAQQLALWAADSKHKPHEVRAYLSSRGIWFIPCLGAYESKTGPIVEMSYLTKYTDFWAISCELCLTQETVLVLGDMDSRSRRSAILHYLIHGDLSTAPSVDLGRLYSIPASEISEHAAWTIPLQQPPMGEILAYVCAQVDKFGDPIKP